MEIQEIHTLIQRQREYFASAATLDVSHRLQALKKLKEAIIRRQQEITTLFTWIWANRQWKATCRKPVWFSAN